MPLPLHGRGVDLEAVLDCCDLAMIEGALGEKSGYL